MNVSNLSIEQLKRAVSIKEQIATLEDQLVSILGTRQVGNGRIAEGDKILNGKTSAPTKRRKMSAAGRAKIAAVQKARWAKVKTSGAAKPSAAPKRKGMSAAGRAKIAAAARARWAKAKAAGKNAL